MNSSVLLICVNHHMDSEVESLLGSFLGLKRLGTEIVLVVNNESIARENTKVRTWARGDLHVIAKYPGRNLGYFGGADWGLEEYLKIHQFPDWTIVANPDIIFPDRDFLVRLREYDAGSAAVVAPQIELASASWIMASPRYQNPCLSVRPSPRRMLALALICRSYPTFVAYQILSSLRYTALNWINKPQERGRRESIISRELEIYAPFGALAIFHRSYFEKGGSLKHGSFMYGEEIFVAETARRLKMKVIFDPRFRVVHKEDCSLRKMLSRSCAQYTRDSLHYLATTYFNPESR